MSRTDWGQHGCRRGCVAVLLLWLWWLYHRCWSGDSDRSRSASAALRSDRGQRLPWGSTSPSSTCGSQRREQRLLQLAILHRQLCRYFFLQGFRLLGLFGQPGLFISFSNLLFAFDSQQLLLLSMLFHTLFKLLVVQAGLQDALDELALHLHFVANFLKPSLVLLFAVGNHSMGRSSGDSPLSSRCR